MQEMHVYGVSFDLVGKQPIVLLKQVTIQQDGSEIEIDSRPSDAIALAVRASAPIFVADEVIEESAIEFEGDGEPPNEEIEAKVTEFREQLDTLTADDFATGPEEDDN